MGDGPVQTTRAGRNWSWDLESVMEEDATLPRYHTNRFADHIWLSLPILTLLQKEEEAAAAKK